MYVHERTEIYFSKSNIKTKLNKNIQLKTKLLKI